MEIVITVGKNATSVSRDSGTIIVAMYMPTDQLRMRVWKEGNITL